MRRLLFKKRVIGTYSAMDGCVKVETTPHFLDETRGEQNCLSDLRTVHYEKMDGTTRSGRTLQSAKGGSLAQHNSTERQKAFQQFEALKGTELAEHAPALLCGLEDKNASHLLDKPFATATTADPRHSTENVLQVQRDMQRGDSMAMADLLARRPRLLQIHLERFIETEHNPHQQLALKADLSGLLDAWQTAEPQPAAAPVQESLRVQAFCGILADEACRHRESMLPSTLNVFTSAMPSAVLGHKDDDAPLLEACLFCMNRARVHSYPCGHKIVCDLCAMREHCPVCGCSRIKMRTTPSI